MLPVCLSELLIALITFSSQFILLHFHPLSLDLKLSSCSSFNFNLSICLSVSLPVCLDWLHTLTRQEAEDPETG